MSQAETFEQNYAKVSKRKDKLLSTSEPSEYSQNLWKKASVIITEHKDLKEIKLPLQPKQLQELQKNDEYCRDISRKLHKDMELQKIFIKERGVLHLLWSEDGRTFKCILVPKVLQDSMIILAHDHSGHNGSRRTYNCLKKQYYWPGIRKQVFRHCKRCAECILQNQGQAQKGFSHFDSPDLPMEFICMDLVGPIHPPSSKGNKFILTVIDMLTGFTMAVPIPNKNSETVCCVYRDHIYCTFGRSSRILTDNGSEFKKKEMRQVCETLGVKHIFSTVYTPESNGCLEGWHRFFKACIVKHIRGGDVEWDELVPLAVSAYNFFPCQSSKESPFMMMFRRDPITPIAKLLEPKPRYYREKGTSLRMDMLRRLYTVIAEIIHKARKKKGQKEENRKPHFFKVNDMVLVKDPDSAVFEPRYQPNYRVTAIFGDNRIEVQDEKGHKSIQRSSHVKYMEPSEKTVQQLPGKEILKNYGRSAKLFIPIKDVPDLDFQIGEDSETVEHLELSPKSVEEVNEVVEGTMLIQNEGISTLGCVNNSKSCNCSESSPGSETGVVDQSTMVNDTMMKQTMQKCSETRNCSENSPKSEEGVAAHKTRTSQLTLETDTLKGLSENREQSEISHTKDQDRSKQKGVSQCEPTLISVSEISQYSQQLPKNW